MGPTTRCIILFTTGLVLVATLPAEALADRPSFAPGEIIVQWRDPDNHPHPTRIAGRQILRRQAIGLNAWVYTLADLTHRATIEAIEALRDDPNVATVDPNFIRQPFRVPNDPHYALQWNIKAVRLEKAWDRTTGGKGNVVAIIDTGILPDHPDLTGRLLVGRDFIADPNSSGDGNGWDAIARDNGTSALSSSAFHGTHVAGVIGATSNNKKGIVGVDWGCRILPVRALGIQQGKGKDSDIVAAIQWSAGISIPKVPNNSNVARVINLSFGGPGASQILTQAIQAAQARGVIVVAAAGNQKQNAKDIYPAAVHGVITVGATQYDGKRAPYSNFGAAVDVMAPGGNMSQNLPFKYENKTWQAGVLGTLYSTTNKTFTYHLFEGTSQSAPMVSGIVTLMLSMKPSLSGSQVLGILKNTANKSYQCKEGCGAGLVDASAALTSAANYQGGKPPPKNSLPFGYLCSSDDQCDKGICRNVAGGNKRICTRFCSTTPSCPAKATCTNGLCVPAPGTSSYSPGNPSPGQNFTGGMIMGSGCALSSTSTESDHSGALLLVLTWLLLARRRS